MAKTTWIPPRFKNQLHCGIVAGERGMESSVAARAGSHYGGPQLSRQNQKPHGKNKIPHGKTKYFTAKTKYLTRQKQIPTAKPKLFCFCREVFDFAVTVMGHHKFAIASNVRIYAVNGFRRVGEAGGGGVQGVRTNPLWDINIEVTENPKNIQKTANFSITVVA